MDKLSEIATARNIGKEEGLAEGKEEGLAEQCKENIKSYVNC